MSAKFNIIQTEQIKTRRNPNDLDKFGGILMTRKDTIIFSGLSFKAASEKIEALEKRSPDCKFRMVPNEPT